MWQVEVSHKSEMAGPFNRGWHYNKQALYFTLHEIHDVSDSMTTIAWHFHRWVSAVCLSVAGPTVAQLWNVISFDCQWVESHFLCYLGQTWFSCSLYSFHSEQAEQKSSVLEHLCWRTPEYSVFRGGVDRTVTWPVPKQDGGALLACVEIFASLDLFRSTPKCPVLLVYVAVLAYAEFSKNC